MSKTKVAASVGIVVTVGKPTFRCTIGIEPFGSIEIKGRNEWLAEGFGEAFGELVRTLLDTARRLDPDGFKAAEPKLQKAWERATDQFAKGEKRISVTC